jgi:hypothetical protein
MPSPNHRGLLVSSPPATEATGALGPGITSRQGCRVVVKKTDTVTQPLGCQMQSTRWAIFWHPAIWTSTRRCLDCHPLFFLFLSSCDGRGPHQGCQMVCFQTRQPNLEKNSRASDWKMLIYFMVIWNIVWPFEIFYDHLVHFVFIWYIFSVWVSYMKKNLATLSHIPALRFRFYLFHLSFFGQLQYFSFLFLQKRLLYFLFWVVCAVVRGFCLFLTYVCSIYPQCQSHNGLSDTAMNTNQGLRLNTPCTYVHAFVARLQSLPK